MSKTEFSRATWHEVKIEGRTCYVAGRLWRIASALQANRTGKEVTRAEMRDDGYVIHIDWTRVINLRTWLKSRKLGVRKLQAPSAYSDAE